MASIYIELYTPYVGPLEDNNDPTIEFMPCKCPFHGDKRASAGISKTTGIFNCFVCGTLSPAQFIHHYAEVSLEDAHKLVDNFRAEHDLLKTEDTFIVATAGPPDPKFQRLFELSQELMRPELSIVKEYCSARMLDYETLTAQLVGYLPGGQTSWRRESLVFPYIKDGTVVGIRYRDFMGNKGGEPGCHFTLWHIDELDKEPDVVILVEGGSDHLATWQALEGKYTVLSTPSSTFRSEWNREFQGVRQVIFIPQGDEASLKMVEQAKRLCEKITVLHLPWKRKQSGKDIPDWLRYNPPERLQALIESISERSTRRILTGFEFAELAKQPRRWLIENLLARRHLCILGGAPKSRKTWMALNIVHTLLSTRPFCNIPGLSAPTFEEQPRVLFIEEEGDLEEFADRIDMVCKDLDWKPHTFWGHHIGVKLDSDVWIRRLEEEIEEKNISLLIMDPFSRMYDIDENTSQEIGKVFNNVAALLTRFKDLSIVILHHFSKVGGIAEGWNAFRGSSRIGAEADLGIFLETHNIQGNPGARLRIDGRSIQTPTTSDGKETFRLQFADGLFTVEDAQSVASRSGSLQIELAKYPDGMDLAIAARDYKVSESTIKSWVERALDKKTGEPMMVIKHGRVYLVENQPE